MKKRIIALLLCALLLPMAAAGAEGPEIPAGDFEATPVTLKKGKAWPVHEGPGSVYGQAGEGKAKVTGDGWVQALGGCDGSYVMVQYAVGKDRLRIGWIGAEALADADAIDRSALGGRFVWRPCHAIRETALTDDPLMSRAAVKELAENASLSYLARMGDWAYAEYAADGESPVCGFVPCEDLAFDPVPTDSNPYFRFITDFLAKAGIEAEPTGIAHGRETYGSGSQTIYFDLKNGGRFWAYAYDDGGYDPLLTPLEFNCRVEDPSDGDLEKYLDAAFSLLADVEKGAVDGARNWKDLARTRQVLVSNALLYHEYLGEQGLRVLLRQLARHDGNDALNSLRARMASRLLGVQDKSGVDPALGCAWYDSMRIVAQDALPPADPALWESDPVLRAAEQALIEKYTVQNAGRYDRPSYDQSKGAYIVSLGECRREAEGNRVILLASMGVEQIAVYGGSETKLISGMWFPVRLTMEETAPGVWTLAEMQEAWDGDEYWSSIVAMCGGDEKLAERLVKTDSGLREAIRAYLTAAGLPEAAESAE